MRYHVVLAGRTLVVEISNEGVSVSGQRVDAKLETIPDSPVRSLLLNDASHRIVGAERRPRTLGSQCPGAPALGRCDV